MTIRVAIRPSDINVAFLFFLVLQKLRELLLERSFRFACWPHIVRVILNSVFPNLQEELVPLSEEEKRSFSNLKTETFDRLFGKFYFTLPDKEASKINIQQELELKQPRKYVQEIVPRRPS
ncbi:uncharacterized protein LOC113005078 isoform X1 [Solenopsis invicta]|uniref:uncharacterized protein LOC113005078 isoform X1 n=1 Tax=Solenopsis invicta TaxID=13686 RepID=UPI00193CE81C|nr:uncharacterized protein LOC113005078 isoform X1 [Solenopsis invicta]